MVREQAWAGMTASALVYLAAGSPQYPAEDWSVTGPDGRLMRPVPDADGLLYGIVPPYWLPRHQVPCRLPDVA